MKKMLVTLFSALICTMSSVAFASSATDNSSVTISQVEIVDYTIYAGAGIFLLGMIFILLSLYLGMKNKDNAEDSEEWMLYESDDEISNDEEAVDEMEEPDALEEAEDAEVLISEEEDIETEEQAEQVAEVQEDDSETEPETEAAEESVLEEENEQEIEQSKKIRITFTGVNNADVRILEITDSATLGRKSTNDIMISDNAVSGTHCKFIYEDDILYVEDLNSTNGTFINGEAVEKSEIKSGDKIVLGKQQYKISISE